MQEIGSVGEQVAVLVNGAALDRQVLAPECDERGFETRRSIDDGEFRPLQAARIEIIEELASG